MAKRERAVRKPATRRKRAPARRRASAAADANPEKAIETLRRELMQALERQKATSDILNVINRSSFELQPVLDTIVQTASRLCDAEYALIYKREGEEYRVAATTNTAPDFVSYATNHPIRPGRGTLIGRTALEQKTVHLPDCLTDPEYEAVEYQSKGKYRTMLGVPLQRGGVPVGVIALVRNVVKPFNEKQIELVSTFADQAVIAIENVRLFDEVQARTNDLAESLQQQTATADVLKVISRSTFDLQTVLDTLTESAAHLCNADMGAIARKDERGFYHATNFNFPIDWVRVSDIYRLQPERGSVIGRTLLANAAVQIPDVLADPEYAYSDMQRVAGYRTLLGVPMLRGKEPVGVLFLGRKTAEPFTDKQIELLQTFADQAVIAIENVRLFDEVRARTDDLRESLQQQTATADVLKVISRSAFNLQTVLDTLVESATRLCEAQDAIIFLPNGETYRAQALHGYSTEYHKFIESNPVAIDRGSVVGRTAIDKQVVHVSDVLADPNYTRQDAQRMAGYRTALGVPLLRHGNVAGVIFLTRTKPEPFSQKQIELITTFADQAVIAIENVRLFDEVQARTEDLRESLQQQTATADVLKVISRSTFDLGIVLRTLVESAARLCEADKATITRQKDGAFYRSESFGFSREFIDHVRDIPVAPDRGTATGRALLEGVVVHIPDVQEDPDYHFDDAQRLGNYRTLLGVPMMREGIPVGVVTLTRSEPRPFTAKQIELVTTFADQAAIAIENVRLFEQVQERTKELSKSLDELRTAQDRLVQTEKLASLGQLTAGIAHEIKNPLNFVNNFSALSVELVDELDDVLKPAALDKRTREEANELTGMLRGNLEKVVQHGKRADSIVRNMLLHSREGSGERRPVDLNSLVAESLNLAYHGARAEKQEFQIRLDQNFDPAAGEIELFPQEITRVLLNLISNGFYAAMKRKAEMSKGYEPALVATTRNLGGHVEIRIRDNGLGIPPEVKEKMFNPFFTTKPPGEGTGLGLSLSYDIIVKQHAGSIEVDTKLGEFTEFRVILPRKAASSKSGANS